MKNLTVCIFLVLIWSPVVFGFSGSGSGTEADPYEVASAALLDEVRDDLTAYYIQTDHIDLSDYSNWTPIAGGGAGTLFAGSYNGDGYKIENLTIDRPNTINVGLFGHVDKGAVIRNVRLETVDVKGARGTGSLIGRVTGNTDTLIERCYAIGGTVVGDGATGGLVGSHNSDQETPGGTDNPIISQCYADIDVSFSGKAGAGKDKFGGLAGCSQKGTIIDSYARGAVTVNDADAVRVGGLAGCILLRGEIIRSFSTGEVTSPGDNVGGLVGNVTATGGGGGGNVGVVTDSYWDTQTSGLTTSAGGTGKTTTEMKTQSTYTNWDFNTIWAIDSTQNDGYPYLLWEDYVQPDSGDPPEPPEPPVVPKSPRAIHLDGIIDRIHVPHDATLNVNGDSALSVEAWVKKDSDQTDEIAVVYKDRAYGLYLENGNEPAFTIYENSTTHQTASSELSLETDRWYHLAGTFDGTYIRIYIDGYLHDTYTYGASVTINDDGEPLGIGADVDPVETNTGKIFHGTIDEVRIWDRAQGETRLRETMCKKITDTETDFGDLQGYWRLNEESGQTCDDDSGNDNTGTIYSGNRVCSGAPIGDESDHDYDSFDVTLSHPDGDQLTAASSGGTWSTSDLSGIHVYRIDEAPNNTAAPFGTNNFNDSLRFWGVFVTGGINPTYTMIYNYAGYPRITDENSLQMIYRNNNCASWKALNAELDTGADTLTKEGLSGTQFIVGSDVDPRNTINYDGSDDYVGITDSTNSQLDLDDNGTLEAWIYPESFATGAGILYKGGTGANTVCYGFGFGSDTGNLFTGGTNKNIGFAIGNTGGGHYLLTGSKNLRSDNWYHVACTWENAATDTRAIYLNGIQYAFSTATITNATTQNDQDLRFGMQQISNIYFDGRIDEVRIWDITRSQTQIRDTMCQKLTGNETGLVGYWRFDRETSDTSTPDYDYGTKNNGTMYNFGSVLDDRICSSAPIGDDSGYGYGTTTTYSFATVSHPDGDYLFATEDTGTWNDSYSGIQVYRVDEAPVYPPDIATSPYAYGTVIGLTPPSGWSSIDYYRYWGVYITDRDNSPKYKVEYHYCMGTADTNCNPSVPDDESVLALAKRDHYCDRTWEDSGATLLSANNYLFATGQTDTEYVLGGTNQPLAISLISFIADVDAAKECIDISWETATEVDTIGYYLWRSISRDGDYEKIEASFVSAKAVDSVHGAKYAYRDCDVYLGEDSSYYYKLEEVDMDNTKENPFYGPIGPVSKDGGANQISSAKSSGGSSGGSSTCFISSMQ